MKWEIKLICIAFALMLASCTKQPADELVLPTGIHTPTQTATLVPTATPTALVLADHGEQTEPYPDLEVITADNVHRLEEVDVWGQGTVLGIALSPDATTIAVSTATGIYFYDAETLEQIDWISLGIEKDKNYWEMAPQWYDNIDYSPDGEYLLIGNDKLYIWNTRNGEVSDEIVNSDLSTKNKIIAVRFNSTGNKFAIIWEDLNPTYWIKFTLEVYDTDTKKSIFQYKISENYLTRNAFFLSEDTVYIQGMAIDFTTGETYSTVNVPVRPITVLPVNEKNWQMYTNNSKLTCDFSIGYQKDTLPMYYDYLEDGSMAVTIARSIRVWDFSECNELDNALLSPFGGEKLAFSRDQNYILINGSFIWDVFTKKAIYSYPSLQLSFNGDGSKLFALLADGSQNMVVDTSSGKIIYSEDYISSNNEFVLDPYNEQRMLLKNQLIDISTQQTLLEIENAKAFFSPDGETIAELYYDDKDEVAKLAFYEAGTAKNIVSDNRDFELVDNDYAFRHYSNFNQDWTYLAIANTENIYIWSINENQFVSEIHNKANLNSPVFFSIDNSILITSYYQENNFGIQIWDVETGKLIIEFPAPLVIPTYSPVISPDGKLLAFLANDGTIRIYGVRSTTK
jgi:WD40 repeat protein